MSSSDVSLLGIVPARGGSKGIRRKNLVNFRGKPLIGYTLEAISEAAVLTDVIVSSEDSEILAYCQQLGFESYYRRPASLASDETPMIDVVLHALDWYEEAERYPDFVVLLQPTSPLRDARDLQGFVSELRKQSSPSLVAVHRTREHPMECVRVDDQGNWDFVVPPTPSAYGRQAYLGDYLFINGSIYSATPAFLRARRSFVGQGPETRFFVMDADHGLDIDVAEDLRR